MPVGKHQGEKPLPLGRMFTLIGSAPSARIYLSSKSISRCHAVIINTGSGLFVRDLASRTQLRLNGRAVNEADLREADVLQVGPFSFRFSDPSTSQPRAPDPPAPAAALEVDGLDEPLPIQSRTLLIGRRESADISLTESSASSAHALLFAAEGKHLLRDLNSRTGTFVNGVKVHEHALSPGDMVRIGETTFRYVRTGGATGASAERAEAESPPPPVKSEPAAPTPPEPEPEQKPEQKSDFDFIPLELEPEIPPGAITAPAGDADLMREGDGSSGSRGIGLVANGEASNGQDVEEPVAETVAPPAPPAPPKVAVPAAQLAAPRQNKRWSKATSTRPNVPAAPSRPARPRNPFDVLGNADELEPLPEEQADADSIPDPTGDNTSPG